MNLRCWSANSMALALFLGICTRSVYSSSRSDLARHNPLVMSRAEYLDRLYRNLPVSHEPKSLTGKRTPTKNSPNRA